MIQAQQFDRIASDDLLIILLTDLAVLHHLRQKCIKGVLEGIDRERVQSMSSGELAEYSRNLIAQHLDMLDKEAKA